MAVVQFRKMSRLGTANDERAPAASCVVRSAALAYITKAIALISCRVLSDERPLPEAVSPLVVFWQRNEATITKKTRALLPAALQELLAEKAS